jgi:hypothetical protein
MKRIAFLMTTSWKKNKKHLKRSVLEFYITDIDN